MGSDIRHIEGAQLAQTMNLRYLNNISAAFRVCLDGGSGEGDCGGGGAYAAVAPALQAGGHSNGLLDGVYTAGARHEGESVMQSRFLLRAITLKAVSFTPLEFAHHAISSVSSEHDYKLDVWTLNEI